MNIQTEYMGYNNDLLRSSNYYFTHAPAVFVKNMWFCPDCSTIIDGAFRLVTWVSNCSPGCHLTWYIIAESSPAFRGLHECHCISSVHCGIWPPLHSDLTTPKHSKWLPVTKLYCGDEHPNDSPHQLYMPVVTFLWTTWFRAIQEIGTPQ